MLTTVLFLIAAALFVAASFGVKARIHLGWLGAAVLAVALAV